METELKIEVVDLARIRTLLAELGATRVGAADEDNLYLDRNDELSSRGESLRLRRDERARLTWKGPSRFADGVIERPEIETTISSCDDALAIFERLGFTVVDRLAKRRETWRLAGVEIALDELAFGSFVELEGPSQATRAIATRLGLDDTKGISVAYRVLQRGRPPHRPPGAGG